MPFSSKVCYKCAKELKGKKVKYDNRYFCSARCRDKYKKIMHKLFKK